MKKRSRSALLSAGLLLSACSITPAPGGVYTVSGNVLAPGIGSAGGGGRATLTVSPPADWSAPHVRGQVLLSGLNETGPNGSPLSAQALTALSGVRTQRLTSAGLTLAYTPAGDSDAAFAARLSASGLTAQPNYRYQALDVPNDPGFPGNAGIRIGGVAYDQDYLTRINAQAAWDELAALGKTPLGARVAVLDTGVNAGHEDLAGRVLPGRDFCAALVNDNCVGEDSDTSDLTLSSEAGHGTSSAGLIGAATNNGKGLAGLTWSGQNILPVKVFGASGAVSGATTVSLTAGVKYAVAQSARIINLSLGFAGSNAGPDGDPALSAALAAATAANVLVVAAAGNTPDEGLYYPASDPNVLAVGALGRSDTLACYSARPISGQKALDLVAPGGNAGSGTATCYQSSPDDLLVLTSAPGPDRSGSGNSLYRLDAGTSFAAPQVSGAAALIRALRPGLTAAQVKSILIGSARTVAGGRLLDVGAAITAASTFDGGTVVVPPPNPAPLTPYSLTVSALQGTVMVAKFSRSGKSLIPSQRLPYRLNNLPAGTYTLSASLTVNGVVSQGQVQVTVGGDTQQDISTQ